MTILSLTSTELARASYLIRWTSDLTKPLYHVYVGGVLIDTTRRNNLTLDLVEGDFASIEVSDSGPLTPAGGEAFAELEWAAVPDTKQYRVEEFDGVSWAARSLINDDGSSQYAHRTLPISDETNAQFRVTAIGADGNESTPAAVTMSAPRHPAPPEVQYTYDDALHQITLTEI